MSEVISATFPKGTKITQPQGGFLLWVELPEDIDSLKLQDLAYRHEISIAPGPMFSPSQGFRNFIRLSCGAAWSKRLADAVKTLGRLARQCQGR